MVWPPGQFICPFLIMCMVSMPTMIILALQNDLNPSIGCVTLLTPRWSCSTMLLRYFDWRSTMSTQASALTLSMAAVLAPLLSIVIFSGTSCRLMARSKKRRAAAIRDGYPVSPGHTLLIPKKHIGSFFDLSGSRGRHPPPLLWRRRWRATSANRQL